MQSPISTNPISKSISSSPMESLWRPNAGQLEVHSSRVKEHDSPENNLRVTYGKSWDNIMAFRPQAVTYLTGILSLRCMRLEFWFFGMAISAGWESWGPVSEVDCFLWGKPLDNALGQFEHGEVPVVDEDITPCVENTCVRRWLLSLRKTSWLRFWASRDMASFTWWMRK